MAQLPMDSADDVSFHGSVGIAVLESDGIIILCANIELNNNLSVDQAACKVCVCVCVYLHQASLWLKACPNLLHMHELGWGGGGGGGGGQDWRSVGIYLGLQ